MTVRGNIGSEQVYLDNAATESTLREILRAIQNQSGEGGVDSETLNTILDRSNINPETVARANSALQGLVKTANLTRGAFDKLNNLSDNLRGVFDTTVDIVDAMVDSAGKSSVIFGQLARQGGIIGLFGSIMEQTAKYAEENLEAFRQLSQSGINFAGSLRDINYSAAKVNLTLDNFVKLMKANSEAFAKLGSGANKGAMEFVDMSVGFQAQFGAGLRALGFTFEDVNQGLANYLTAVGGLTKKERADKQKLFAATNKYLVELDLIAQITGKQREEIEEQGKAATLQAAVNRKLQSMDSKSAGQVASSLRLAAATGIPGLLEAMQARLLGLPETTEQARMLAGFAPEIVQAAYAMMDNARSGMIVNFASELKTFGNAVGTVTGRMSSAGENTISIIDALTMLPGDFAEVSTGILSFENTIRNVEDIEKLAGQLTQEQTELKQAEAAKAAEAEENMMKIRKQLIDDLTQLGTIAMPLLFDVIKFATQAVDWFKGLVEGLPGGLVTAIGIIIGSMGLLNVALIGLQAAINAAIIKSTLGGGGGIGAGLAGFGKNLLKGTGLALAGTGVGLAGNFAADQLGRETTEGKAVSTLGSAGQYALYGAALGSVVPVLGTTAGAVLGGLLGAGLGAYENFVATDEITKQSDLVAKQQTEQASLASANAEMMSSTGKYGQDWAKDFMAQQPRTTTEFASSSDKILSDLLRINNETLVVLKSLNDNVDRAVYAVKGMNTDLFR